MLAITDEDAAVFRQEAPGAVVVTCPMAIMPSQSPIVNQREDASLHAMYLGNSHEGNMKAVRFLLLEVVPIIVRRVPDFHLTVIGGSQWIDVLDELLETHPALNVSCSTGDDKIRRFKTCAHVTAQTAVLDLSPLLRRVTVIASPVLVKGTGISTKVFYAMSHSIPVVTTTAGAYGIPCLRWGARASGLCRNLHICNGNPGAYARALVRAHKERLRVSTQAPGNEATTGYDQWLRVTPLMDLLRAVHKDKRPRPKKLRRRDFTMPRLDAPPSRKTPNSEPSDSEPPLELPSSEPRLPDFMVIGGQRGGILFLAQVLQQSGRVHIPPSEKHFFDFGAPATDIQGYSAYLGGGKGQLVGERASDYLFDAQAPLKIYRLVPSVRLVVVLRNPIDRALSHWRMNTIIYANQKTSARHTTTFDRDIWRQQAHTKSVPAYISRGFYDEHLARYDRVFQRSRIWIAIYEDVVHRGPAARAQIFEFLGLEVPPCVVTMACPVRRSNSTISNARAELRPTTKRRLRALYKDSVARLRHRMISQEPQRLDWWKEWANRTDTRRVP